MKEKEEKRNEKEKKKKEKKKQEKEEKKRKERKPQRIGSPDKFCEFSYLSHFEKNRLVFRFSFLI